MGELTWATLNMGARFHLALFNFFFSHLSFAFICDSFLNIRSRSLHQFWQSPKAENMLSRAWVSICGHLLQCTKPSALRHPPLYPTSHYLMFSGLCGAELSIDLWSDFMPVSLYLFLTYINTYMHSNRRTTRIYVSLFLLLSQALHFYFSFSLFSPPSSSGEIKHILDMKNEIQGVSWHVTVLFIYFINYFICAFFCEEKVSTFECVTEK